MTEQLLRRLGVYAGLKQRGRIAVPDLMQRDRHTAGSAVRLVELAKIAVCQQ